MTGLACAILLAGARSAPAAGGDGDSVTLPALLAAARARNPEIKAAEARYRAMRERPSQEGTLPDPMIGIRYHNEESDRITFGESDFSFVEVAAEQEVPFPGKLGLKAEIAGREAERERAMSDVTLLMVLAKVAAAFSDLVVVDRSMEILDESMAALELMARQADATYRVGTAAQQDVLRATLERDALHERHTMLERKRAAAAAMLRALLNRSNGEPLGKAAWPATIPTLRPLPELARQLASRSPELRAAGEDVLRTDAALALARREYLPDFALMGAYMNKNGLFPEWELGMRVKVPLYFWRRQRAGVAEASHAKAAAKHARRTARVSLEAQLADLHSMGAAAEQLVALYSRTLIPQAELTLASARVSYTVGKVDFLTTLSTFTALLEYRMRYAEEVGQVLRALAEIGPLIGETPEQWLGGSAS